MGRVNRRIGKSSETAVDTTDGTGGGVLDAFIHDYFNRSGNLITVPGEAGATGMSASGGIMNEFVQNGSVYRSHTFTGSGNFVVDALSSDFPNTVEYLVVAGGPSHGGQAGGEDRPGSTHSH